MVGQVSDNLTGLAGVVGRVIGVPGGYALSISRAASGARLDRVRVVGAPDPFERVGDALHALNAYAKQMVPLAFFTELDPATGAPPGRVVDMAAFKAQRCA